MSQQRVGVDSSVMVAAVCTWHEHHAAAATDLERRLSNGQTLVVAGQALAETYAVLTRLPPPHRLSPADAWILVRHNFIDNATVVSLSARGYSRAFATLAAEGIAGGQTYDAVIAASYHEAGVDLLVTFNRRHFERVAPHLTVAVPGE